MVNREHTNVGNTEISNYGFNDSYNVLNNGKKFVLDCNKLSHKNILKPEADYSQDIKENLINIFEENSKKFDTVSNNSSTEYDFIVHSELFINGNQQVNNYIKHNYYISYLNKYYPQNIELDRDIYNNVDNSRLDKSIGNINRKDSNDNESYDFILNSDLSNNPNS